MKKTSCILITDKINRALHWCLTEKQDNTSTFCWLQKSESGDRSDSSDQPSDILTGCWQVSQTPQVKFKTFNQKVFRWVV